MATHKGFHKAPCPTCERVTWHYEPPGTNGGHCTHHSVWPPARKPIDVSQHVMNMGGMLTRTPQTSTVPSLRKREEGTMKPLRVQFACGHWSTVAKERLCMQCREAVQKRQCRLCIGYVQPLPSCPCGSRYTFDEKGEDVRVACGYCTLPVRPGDAAKVIVGRWGKRAEEVGQTAEGEPIIETRSFLYLRQVMGCAVCTDLYRRLCVLTEEGHRAFLPL